MRSCVTPLDSFAPACAACSGSARKAAVSCRLNVLVSGGTGAGKTTLLNVLSSFIHNDERVVFENNAHQRVFRIADDLFARRFIRQAFLCFFKPP